MTNARRRNIKIFDKKSFKACARCFLNVQEYDHIITHIKSEKSLVIWHSDYSTINRINSKHCEESDQNFVSRF